MYGVKKKYGCATRAARQRLIFMRILLTSDLHLGIDERSSAVPGHARINTFKKICAIASEHDLLLVAGDLFHDGGDKSSLLAAADTVSREFSALRRKGVDILYTPGECDRSLLGEDGPAPTGCFTHIFPSGGGSGISITRGDESVSVYGATDPRGMTAIRSEENGGFHMALLHADFCAGEQERKPDVPSLGRDDIRSLNMDFYALGHNHNFRIFKSRNRVIGAYPGSPEAVGPNETGERYVLSITTENGEIIQIKRLAVNSITVERISIACANIGSSREIADIVERKASPRTAITVVLTGERAFPLDLDAIMEHARGFERLDIVDQSSPDLNLLAREYAGENSFRGAFFERMREMIEAGELPADIDRMLLGRMLGRMAQAEAHGSEDWHCV